MPARPRHLQHFSLSPAHISLSLCQSIITYLSIKNFTHTQTHPLPHPAAARRLPAGCLAGGCRQMQSAGTEWRALMYMCAARRGGRNRFAALPSLALNHTTYKAGNTTLSLSERQHIPLSVSKTVLDHAIF